MTVQGRMFDSDNPKVIQADYEAAEYASQYGGGMEPLRTLLYEMRFIQVIDKSGQA